MHPFTFINLQEVSSDGLSPIWLNIFGKDLVNAKQTFWVAEQ